MRPHGLRKMSFPLWNRGATEGFMQYANTEQPLQKQIQNQEETGSQDTGAVCSQVLAMTTKNSRQNLQI